MGNHSLKIQRRVSLVKLVAACRGISNLTVVIEAIVLLFQTEEEPRAIITDDPFVERKTFRVNDFSFIFIL